MAIRTIVIVRDPVNPYDLFAAARRVVGDPPRWREHDFGAIRMLQADGGRAPGRRSPCISGPGRSVPGGRQPDRYAAVTFTSSGFGSLRARHARLVAGLGALLAAGGLSWMWQYEDGPWRSSRPKAGHGLGGLREARDAPGGSVHLPGGVHAHRRGGRRAG